MSINVPGDLFSAAHSVDMILETLRSHDVPPQCLCVEITETAIIHDEGECKAALTRLRNAGVKIALDDFGTGYSSLNHLRQFDVDLVKIDRSFLQTVLKSRTDRDMTRLIVQLARRRGLKVIAEGVDSDEKLKVLRDLGCAGMQGFLYGEPVCSGQFGEWLEMLQEDPASDNATSLTLSA